MDNGAATGLLLAMAVLILAARVAGSLARSLNQPRVLGELIVGVILGPSLLDLLHTPSFGLSVAPIEETIRHLADFGVLLLMFSIGLELHLAELRMVGKVAGFAGVAGALLPVILTFSTLLLFGYGWPVALFAGVTFAATSVSISAQVLLELGILRTKVGNALLASALVDDVIAILLVSLAVALIQPPGADQQIGLLAVLVRMIAYLLIAFLIAWYALPPLINWIHTHPDFAHSFGVPAVAIVCAFLFGWTAEHFGGVAAITGAFIAGVGLSRSHETIKRQISIAVSNLCYAFLVPVFFVHIGLQIDLHTFPLSAIPLAAVLLVIAIASKIIGGLWGARQGGFTEEESLQLGICMIARGEVGLIIATLGLMAGVFSPEEPLFATLFLIILITTVLTPSLVRRIFASAIVEAKVAPKRQKG